MGKDTNVCHFIIVNKIRTKIHITNTHNIQKQTNSAFFSGTVVVFSSKKLNEH